MHYWNPVNMLVIKKVLAYFVSQSEILHNPPMLYRNWHLLCVICTNIYLFLCVLLRNLKNGVLPKLKQERRQWRQKIVGHLRLIVVCLFQFFIVLFFNLCKFFCFFMTLIVITLVFLLLIFKFLTSNF